VEAKESAKNDMNFPLFPEEASDIARRVDGLFIYLMAVCGAVVLGILVVIIYFLFKYRRGKSARRGLRQYSSTLLEVTWTIIPLGIFMTFFVWGSRLYYDIQNVPEDGLQINVVGKQWMWKIEHPNGRREIDELHVPVNRNIKLLMASEDVIHSFYLPAFRIKQDVVPGRYTTEWFNATKPGVYHLFCAEFCGKDHSRMGGRVIVMEPEAYQWWLRHGQPDTTLAQTGAKLYRQLGCSGCHDSPSTVKAPPLDDLYLRPVPLQNGKVIKADERYIHDSILLPHSEIAAGYEPIMPSFKGQVSEEQIFALIAYIKTLGGDELEYKKQRP
jgi:cytochrome c oxidase subunit 2